MHLASPQGNITALHTLASRNGLLGLREASAGHPKDGCIPLHIPLGRSPLGTRGALPWWQRKASKRAGSSGQQSSCQHSPFINGADDLGGFGVKFQGVRVSCPGQEELRVMHLCYIRLKITGIQVPNNLS